MAQEKSVTQLDREIPKSAKYGWLCDYKTGERIRHATREERDASVAQALWDKGRGVFATGGRDCYVEE